MSPNFKRGKTSGQHTSKFKGVHYLQFICWHGKKYENKKPYMAKICVGGKVIFLGRYVTEKDAALAYNNYVIENLPKGSFLNEINHG